MNNRALKMSRRGMVLGLGMMLTLFSNGTWAQKDSRETIVLDAEASSYLFEEMKQYVSGLQQALTALAKDDLQGVATAVRPLGMQGMANTPKTLTGAVPDGFIKIGMPIHMAFDKIADAAEKGASSKEILSGLGMAMSRCVACHAAYRVESN